MSKQITKNETTTIESTESVPMVEQVQAEPIAEAIEETATIESPKSDPSTMPTGAIVQAILSSSFAQDARLTGYQLHVVINIAFTILKIEKDGAILQIAPQMIYSATKLRKGETYDLIRALTFVTNYVERRRSGMVAQGERLNPTAILAAALKSLS